MSIDKIFFLPFCFSAQHSSASERVRVLFSTNVHWSRQRDVCEVRCHHDYISCPFTFQLSIWCAERQKPFTENIAFFFFSFHIRITLSCPPFAISGEKPNVQLLNQALGTFWLHIDVILSHRNCATTQNLCECFFNAPNHPHSKPIMVSNSLWSSQK